MIQSVVNEVTDDKASEYDFCMVFKTVQSKDDDTSMTLDNNAKAIVQKLIDNGYDCQMMRMRQIMM